MAVLPALVIQSSAGCISVPGWAVLGVAAMLTAPRLAKEILRDRLGSGSKKEKKSD